MCTLSLVRGLRAPALATVCTEDSMYSTSSAKSRFSNFPLSLLPSLSLQAAAQHPSDNGAGLFPTELGMDLGIPCSVFLSPVSDG